MPTAFCQHASLHILLVDCRIKPTTADALAFGGLAWQLLASQ